MDASSKAKRHSLQLQPLHLLSSSPPPSPGAFTPTRASRRQSSINLPYRPPPNASREPVTLGEKHSDLLHFIAQKESKCLELRSQLAVHEKELLELKRKWERIVQRGFDRQQQQQVQSSPQPPRMGHAPTSSSSSSATQSSVVSSATSVTSEEPSSPPHRPFTDSPTSSVSSLPSPVPLAQLSASLPPEISSWISTNIPQNIQNMNKKWDISKRASLFGQSIAQALELQLTPAATTTPPPTPPPAATTKLGRAGSLGRRAGSRLSSPPSNNSSSTSPHPHPPSTPSSPKATPSPAPVPNSQQPTSRSRMSLTKTQEVEEEDDEAWNW